MEEKTVRFNEAQWLRGALSGMLMDKHGCRCVVGHIASQLGGVNDKMLIDHSHILAEDLPANLQWLMDQQAVELDGKVILGGSVQIDLNGANDQWSDLPDDVKITDEMRITEINEILQPHGIQIEVDFDEIPTLTLRPEGVKAPSIESM